MKISVFCPTRDRPEMLCQGIDSLINTSQDLSDIEFIFRFDEDDVETASKVSGYYNCHRVMSINVKNKFTWGESEFKVHAMFSMKHNVTMKFIIGKRHGYSLINRYNDEQMFIADGEYLFHWTDDFELVENKKYSGWDTIIREGQGQNYIFVFRQHLKYHKTAVGPIGLPKAWFQLNGRLCPNVLDDWWYEEICKVLPEDTRVILDWEVKHNNVWKTDKMDETSKNGRDVFDKERENNTDGYEYYSEEEMFKIAQYVKDNPNTKKTSQLHDNSLVGQTFAKGSGASGRWKR